jgi:hypothetical protein
MKKVEIHTVGGKRESGWISRNGAQKVIEW